MGCASAVNRKDDDDSKKIIRLDLQTIKSTVTPKNEINLMKLTEQLLKVLEILCGDEKQKFEKFQDQIINNTLKLERKQDEVTYLLSIAKEQMLVFQENGQIINLCFDLVTHLAKMLELNQKTFLEKDEWYYKFSYVLIYEIAEFKNILSYLVENSTVKQQYQKSKEILFLYSCIIGTIRFLEGISWGYSVFLMHQQLDLDNIYSAKVMFNLMLRLKQHFRENKDFQNAFQNDKPSLYHSEHYFRNLLSYSSIEKLITELDYKKEDKRNQHNMYLQNQVFRKTYVNVKKQMDDWLRKTVSLEISVNELKKYKAIMAFTRSYLRDLKNPIKKSSTGETSKPLADTSSLPSLEIDNSANILVLMGDDSDTKVIVESFLQANIKARTKYKCCVLHHCIRENKITQDSYYIVKNIIYQIMRTIPSLKNYMKLQEHNFIKEMISQFDPDKLDLQKDYPEIFVKFCKVLAELKLDFNIGIIITGIENIYQQNRLDNLIYLLRSCSIFFPNSFKIIVTMEKRASKTDKIQKILRILQTNSIIEINDQDTFINEGRSYLEFALYYGAGQSTRSQFLQQSAEKEDTVEKKEPINKSDNLELCLQKCAGSYRKGIEIIYGIHRKGIHPKDKRAIREFISNFQFEDQVYKNNISRAIEFNQEVAIDVFNAMCSTHGPIHLETLINILCLKKSDQTYPEKLKQTLKICAEIFSLQNSQITKANASSTPEDFIDNLKTVIILKKRGALKQALKDLSVPLTKNFISDKVYQYHIATFESGDVENEFEDLDTYFRIYVFKHLGKSSLCEKVFNVFENLFCVKNLYKQILYHRSYLRFRSKLMDFIESQYLDKDEKHQLFQFSNILCLIEQTIKNEPLNFLDFCTQLRGRILGESISEFLTDLRLDITSENICYFKNFHHALRENPRIDIVLKMPKCTVLKIKFFADKKRVIISLSNGLLLLYSLNETQVLKVFANRSAIIDSLKLIEDRYLITAGIDPKIRIWNIDTDKNICKFQVHQYSTIFMICHKECIYSYGYDMKLAKYNFKNQQLEQSVVMENQMSALKLLKTLEENNKYKIAAGFITGQIIIYDLNLVQLKTVMLKTANEEVIQLINLQNTEFLSFTKEGSICIMNNITLDENKAGSIFNLKSEDYIDLILIKSREFFLFTLERQKIEFYSASTFKRTDSWDYFFERDLICCDKNKEGSKIFVSDKSGYLILFNFLKHLDQSKENLVPCNRRYDPVVCIQVTERLDTNSIISCSQDRDLRIWRRDNGVFIKKYDLSSFTGENITSMKLGKDENMLFLGSKDMNVYLIDIAKGKLCVVYEGHWNRVTEIYTIPNKDILITISESNIKVWDLEYDECIKNMNDHNSSIVFISQSPQDEEQVMTIGQSFELKIWNYVTGSISESHEIELNKDKKQLKNLNVVCCDVQQELAYIALNTNEICIYSVKDNKVLYSFISYNDEQIIFLNGIKTDHANYLVVVTRTACILYLVQKESTKRVCSYLVNARKKPKKKKHDNKYSYNVRYYFTSAKICLLSTHQSQTPGMGGTTPIGGFNSKRQGFVKNGSSLAISTGNMPEPSTNLNLELQTTKEQNKGQNDENSLGINGASSSKIVDTMGTKIKDTVVLVCLGDSRGFVHMNHLILK